ncbi:MAG: hypothetical protein NTZ05_15105, partial [Chloroflexi bacterium]|nr:hypothetical protein [Chloroflexota bacterium]
AQRLPKRPVGDCCCCDIQIGEDQLDTLAHGIWSALAFTGQSRPRTAWAVLWGTAPDLVPSTALVLMAPLYGFQRSTFGAFYPFTHSLVFFGITVLIAGLVLRSIPWVMFPWALHILVDIPGHQRFLTPFLFPLSDFRFMGLWEWLSIPMLLANWLAIASVLVLVGLYRRRSRRMERAATDPSELVS